MSKHETLITNHQSLITSDKWYVIHTKPRAESTAVINLERQGFRVHFPRLVRPARIRGRWTDRIEPLFPRYLFLRADVATQSIAPVRSTTGVAAIVRFGMEYATVPDALIENLRSRAEQDTGLHRLGRPLFTPGDTVKVLEGPFRGLEGIFECQEGEERVLILLELLGRDTRVRIPVHQLAPLAA